MGSTMNAAPPFPLSPKVILLDIYDARANSVFLARVRAFRRTSTISAISNAVSSIAKLSSDEARPPWPSGHLWSANQLIQPSKLELHPRGEFAQD